MPVIECENCHKPINLEKKDFIIEDKCYYHQKCYLSHIKKENRKKYLPKLKKFSVYFLISLILFIILSFFQDLTNNFLLFLAYFILVLTISFGVIMIGILFQLIRLK